LGGSVIPPGQSTRLTAKVNFRGKRGKQEKKITVYSNDPAQSKAVLKLYSHVFADVDLVPKRADFRNLSPDQKAETTVEIVNSGQEPLNITGLETSGSFFTVKQETVEEGRKYILRVKTAPPFKGKSLRGTIIVRTDHPRYRAIPLPVNVRVVNDLVAVPSTVTIPDDGTGGPPITFRLVLRSRKGQDFGIGEIDTPLSGITVMVEPSVKGSSLVEIRNLTPSAELNGKFIRFVTDADPAQEVSVPIRVYRERKVRP